MTPPKARKDTVPFELTERILNAAWTAIEEHGPDALTGQIAQCAKLARPNVYRHFVSKDELDEALAHRAYRELRAEIQACLDVPGTPLAVIRAVIAAYARWAHSHPNLYRFLVSRGYHRRCRQRTVERSELAAEITAAVACYFPRVADDPDAVEATLVALVGLIDASVLRSLTYEVGRSDQLIERLTAHTWLILDHHLRKIGVHVDPTASLARLPGRK